MNSREIVKRSIEFTRPLRIPYALIDEFGSDFAYVNMQPSPDKRPSAGADEWGVVWHNIGVSHLGEAAYSPLQSWDQFSSLHIPDIADPRRWLHVPQRRAVCSDKFLIGTGISIYERAHFVRGLENLWADILLEPNELRRLLDILVDMNLYAIEQYARAGVDGYMFCDDWGLQNRLMISPQCWREIWQPCYARIYQAAHAAGLYTFLHSCGYIVDILDDLIAAGLDVIQMDQQENMGLELLGSRFAGRITFWCPVDIQRTMRNGTPAEIKAYCHRMARCLGTPQGGFMAKWYEDPVGAGHSMEAVRVMCAEFAQMAAGLAG